MAQQRTRVARAMRNGCSGQEDPAAEDLGPDPTWNRVHSTPAGTVIWALFHHDLSGWW